MIKVIVNLLRRCIGPIQQHRCAIGMTSKKPNVAPILRLDRTQMGILWVLLSVSCGHANATWQDFGSADDSSIYVDNQQIQRVGDDVYVWTMWDHAKPKSHQGNSYRSTVYREIYDCKLRRRAVSAIRYYSEQKAAGTLVHSFDIQPQQLKFTAATPGSIADALASLVCADPSLTAQSKANESGEAVFQSVKKSIAVIRTDAGKQGSGVGYYSIPNEGTLIATNCHVLEGSTKISVEANSLVAPAIFIGGNDQFDTCIIFSKIKIEVPQVADSIDTRIGQRVYAIGAPLGLELTMSEGIISSKRGTPFDPPMLIQTTASISPGSSGGGLFDAAGRLLGVTTFYLKNGQNLNFAVSINMFSGLLKDPPIKNLAEVRKERKEVR